MTVNRGVGECEGPLILWYQESRNSIHRYLLAYYNPLPRVEFLVKNEVETSFALQK